MTTSTLANERPEHVLNWVKISYDEYGSRRIIWNIPSRVTQTTITALSLGCFFGIVRGGRRASLKFLVENAHRAPKTVEGWYFYKKTKNYKVWLASFQEGGRTGLRFAGIAGFWAGMESELETIAREREGEEEDGEEWWRQWVRHTRGVVAGIATGALWCVTHRLDWRTSKSLLGYGFGLGGIMQGLHMTEDLARQKAQVQTQVQSTQQQQQEKEQEEEQQQKS